MGRSQKNGRGKRPIPVEDLSDEENLQLVIDFVRRLRRVALHPLSLGTADQMPGVLLHKLRQQAMQIAMVSDTEGTLRSPLPNEVLFESLAVRIRVFTITSDRLYYVRAFEALDRLTGTDRADLANASAVLRRRWDDSTKRPDNPGQQVNGYFIVTEDGSKLTDVDLAWAWLYEDSIHGDEQSTSHLGVVTKFAAAVGVFAHMAVVAMQTLHHINELCGLGIIHLPPGTFSDTVVVNRRDFTMKVVGFGETEVGRDLTDLDPAKPLPDDFRSMSDLVAEFNKTRSSYRPE